VRARLAALVAVATTSLLAGMLPAATGTTAVVTAASEGTVRSTAATVSVGQLTLHPCPVLRRALCGRLHRAWDPTGSVRGRVGVGFAFVPARDRTRPAFGTLVPHEGGPGYSTTGSASLYRQMYGPLLERRNLLLVDQRGTGLSEPVRCRALQRGLGSYTRAAAACGRSLGDRANLYGSALSADDLAAVVRALDLGRVDLYGDSYGTFFASVFAGRHGDLLRSVVLDSAYPPTGETAWYPTQGPAMLRSIDLACARTPPCRSAGPTTSRLLHRVLQEVRASPYRGVAADADGELRRVVVDARALVVVTFGATYGPATYRELPGALRAALSGYRKPLLRLVAESLYGGTNGDPADYSEGLDAAVACHDYPQLYDMTAAPRVRRSQLADAVQTERGRRPGLYAPFTIREYLGSDWQMADWCLDWPVAPRAHPAGPPGPPSGRYPATPTLVLSGELDSITTAEEGAQVAAGFPAARHVQVANSFHVTALGDTDDCAVHIVRRFVARPRHGLTASRLGCANEIPPLRAVAYYPRSFRQVPPAAARPGTTVSRPALRAAGAAVRTGADLLDRWFNNYSGTGRGLHGGRWSYRGDRVVTFRLRRVRLHADLAVSGRLTWSRYGHTVRAHLRVRRTRPSGAARPGGRVDGTLDAEWDTRAPGAAATVAGRLDGRPLSATLRAP